MITKQVIKELYKKYNRRPESPFDLNLGLLFESAVDNHGIILDEEKLIIGSLPEGSLFRSIALKHIHEIVDFEDCVAVVLHSSIIFLNKNDNKTYVNIRNERPSLWDRVCRHVHHLE